MTLTEEIGKISDDAKLRLSHAEVTMKLALAIAKRIDRIEKIMHLDDEEIPQ